ncbi:MAG: MopE-related protein [Myxococcota bacterium]
MSVTAPVVRSSRACLVACFGIASGLALTAIAACSGDTQGAVDTLGGDSAVATDIFVPVDVPTFDSAADSAADAADSADSAPADVVIQPHQFGAPCVGNADCNSGYCVPGPHGDVCTQTCTSDCPADFDCRLIDGTVDVVYLCVPRVGEAVRAVPRGRPVPGQALRRHRRRGPLHRRADPAAEAGASDACRDGYTCETDADGSYCQPTSGSCTCLVDDGAAVDGGVRSCSRVGSGADAGGTCYGIERCAPETGWGACSARTPAAETCNGEDDDCDGPVDDGLPVDEACQNTVDGVGSCAGVKTCAGQAGWICQGPTPRVEACNGEDDDCDGETDEDFQDAAGHFTTDADCGRCGNDCATHFLNGEGVCGGSAEAPVCTIDHCDPGFVLIGNQCIPPIDVSCSRCAIDSDCYGGSCVPTAGDGGQDFCLMPCADTTRACPSGFACQDVAAAGGGTVPRCAPTSGSCACTASLVGARRTCQSTNALGTCLGLETCGAGGWGACSAPTPTAETCNGDDDDCDGVIDDDVTAGLACTNTVAGVGACPGSTLCLGALGTACIGPTPALERCNGQDDDCDGATDEDYKDASGRFTKDDDCGGCGIACAGRIAHGVGRCGGSPDAPTCVVASCAPGYIALNDFQCTLPPDLGCQSCASDADCKGGTCTSIDGQSVCVSPCGQDGVSCAQGFVCGDLAGQKRCLPANGSCTCTAATAGDDRTCRRQNAAGTCFGLETCHVPGGWQGCSAETPAAEVCNGRDDDCDGTADDGVTPPGATCQVQNGLGTCLGTYHCQATSAAPGAPPVPVVDWVCDARTPANDVCNTLDDDCDGKTDEDYRDASGAYVSDANCGACGVSCVGKIPDATAHCAVPPTPGAAPRCEVFSCNPGFYQAGPLTCFPVSDDTCSPCQTDANCPTPGDKCLDLDGARFCGRDCAAGNLHGTAAGQCPSGNVCTSFGAARQCVPLSGSCSCRAGDQGATRPCVNQGAAGTCYGSETCDPAVGWSACTARTPAVETCNGQDDDCDAAVDDVIGRGTACTIQNGFGTCAGTKDCVGATLACAAQTPAAETCNGKDDDCDSQTDELPAAQGPLCPKQLGVCAGARQLCAGSAGFLACNIGSYGASYEVSETTCDGLDNDCDGQTDEVDLDGDGHRQKACGGDDCDDFNRLSYPGATEICGDALDNDCNGTADDKDGDHDGFVAAACGGDDCNDASAAASPAKAEVCGDHLDNDCDGSVDNKDKDLDGFLDPACGGIDCDDTKSAVHPGAAEVCNLVDDDCNGATDDTGKVEVCGNTVDEDCSGALDDKDVDKDGERDKACSGGTDCDDADPAVSSHGTEIWDAKDDDCDGLYDEGVIPAGTVIVTEIMRDPQATTDPVGEYFEVTNVGAQAVNLHSWVMKDLGIDNFTVTQNVVVAPGASAVFCHDADLSNGGAACDFEYGAGMQLANATNDSGSNPIVDEVILTLGGAEIDRVEYHKNGWPSVAGRAMSLDPAQYSRLGNDTAGNWCLTDTAYQLSGGDYGTPGRPNPSCSGKPAPTAVVPDNGVDNGGEVIAVTGSGFTGATAVTVGGTPCASFTVLDDNDLTCTTPAHSAALVSVVVTKAALSGTLGNSYRFTGEAVVAIDFADLQFPKTMTVQNNTVSGLIYGQVHSPNVTEPAGAPSGILAQVGYGPLGSDPRNDPGWLWSTANWNKQFFANDEFMRTLVIPLPGTYSYAYRFSDDGGTNYMYGDYDPGTADGFQKANLGTITVQ